MRRVVRVAVRAAEEEVVDVELADLHARRGANGDCRRRRSASAGRIRPRAGDPRSRRSIWTPSAFTCPASRVSSATSAAAPASWMIGTSGCERIRFAPSHREQHRRHVAGGQRLREARRKALRVDARRGDEEKARGFGAVRHGRMFEGDDGSLLPIRQSGDFRTALRPPSSPDPPSTCRSPPGRSSWRGARRRPGRP